MPQQLLPVMRDVSGDFFIFQQDSAPAHRARDTVRFLEQSTPAFIPPDLAYGRRITPTSTWSITRCGVTSSSESISRSCTALTNWRSVCWTFSTAWIRASLTMQLMGGVSVFERLYRQKADISSICCKLDNSVVCRNAWQDIIRFIEHDVCKLSQIWTLTVYG